MIFKRSCLDNFGTPCRLAASFSSAPVRGSMADPSSSDAGSVPGFDEANWLVRGKLIHAGYPGASDDDVAAIDEFNKEEDGRVILPLLADTDKDHPHYPFNIEF